MIHAAAQRRPSAPSPPPPSPLPHLAVDHHNVGGPGTQPGGGIPTELLNHEQGRRLRSPGQSTWTH